VDGPVYAQPLFVPGVEVPERGKHDVLFVATEHDSVYAFDAKRPNDPPLWHVSFLDDKQRIQAVGARDVQCPFIVPEVGITSPGHRPAYRYSLRARAHQSRAPAQRQ